MPVEDELLMWKVKYVNWDHIGTHKAHKTVHTTKRTTSLPLAGIVAGFSQGGK